MIKELLYNIECNLYYCKQILEYTILNPQYWKRIGKAISNDRTPDWYYLAFDYDHTLVTLTLESAKNNIKEYVLSKEDTKMYNKLIKYCENYLKNDDEKVKYPEVVTMKSLTKYYEKLNKINQTQRDNIMDIVKSQGPKMRI